MGADCPILVSLTQNPSRVSISFRWPEVNTRILDPDLGSLSFRSPYQTSLPRPYHVPAMSSMSLLGRGG